MEFLVKEQLLQALLNYLATRPFNEVAGLITEMQKLKPQGEADKKEKK